jgi:hypothetical protein
MTRPEGLPSSGAIEGEQSTQSHDETEATHRKGGGFGPGKYEGGDDGDQNPRDGRLNQLPDLFLHDD